MQCSLCRAENPPNAAVCTKCSTPLPTRDPIADATLADGTLNEGPTPRGTSAWSVAITPSPGAPYAQGTELVGTLLAERYEILELLGQGGMGAVYKARDTELERFVALKLIRADLAGNPEILRRFKQELILAREVTHRNVIRIFDLGQAKGFKFITMEFVEGRDLRAVIREKQEISPEETVPIISQVCRALESAHAAGVVHRDLKPQNIMLDAKDRVYVMDFGIAHSLETPGMTQTGALMGTPEYMSPEQAKGQKVDPRSDLFALGIIFYEMLTGISPFKADTALATLLKRTQERPPTPAEVDPTIPQAISDVVMKCLEIDRDCRYSTAREILEDLGQEMPTSVRTVATRLVIPVPQAEKVLPFVRYRVWIAGGAAVVLLAVLGITFGGKVFPAKSPAPVEQASLAILPFRNASGDATLDWLGPSLADMLSTDVGQSAGLRTISPDRLHQILSDLRIAPGTAIDPTMVGRIAEFSNADTVVSGQYAKFGDQIRIDATLLDLKHNRSAPLKIEAAGQKEIPAAVDGLSELIRKNLAVSPDVLKELKASSFQPSSKSVPALRDYNQGVQLLRDGKNLEAVKTLRAAIQEDPQFALAYSRLAETDSALGYDTDAEKYSRKAVELSQQLPLAEKYLIEANHARVVKDNKKAIEAYENLSKTAPGNADVQSALAGLYEDSGDFAKATAYYQKILAANPKDLLATLAIGRIALKAGNAQQSLEPLNRALSLSIQVGNDEEKATSLHSIGYAYEILNKPEEALRNYEQALEIRRRIGEKRGMAKSLNKMARVEALLGKQPSASAHFYEALQVNREIGDKRGLGDTLLDLGNFYDDSGDHERSLKLYKESLQIERDIGNEALQAICLNNIGSVYFSKGEYQDALTYFQQALQLREKSKVPQDIVESVHNVAETSARMGQYDTAVTEYMRALELRRSISDARGGAIESYSLGTLFDYQGRFGAAINSKQAALETFRGLKDRTIWMAEILGGYAEALTLAGRGQESQVYLEEALNLSRELKNDGLVAQTLAFQGDSYYYRGDSKSARSYYERAVEAAAHTKEPDKALIAKADLARADIDSGRAAPAITSLRSVAKQAEDQGYAYIAVECSVYMADAMVRSHDALHAREELERALVQADKLGLKPLSAKAHYLLATTLRASGNQVEAQQDYRSSAQMLDAMRKEAGAEKILQRSDLKTIYDDASRWTQTATN
jgi:tetratricopeptide (TPR) repeat protein/TolB-like protein/predicted Ser/Thr protein kinase